MKTATTEKRETIQEVTSSNQWTTYSVKIKRESTGKFTVEAWLTGSIVTPREEFIGEFNTLAEAQVAFDAKRAKHSCFDGKGFIRATE